MKHRKEIYRTAMYLRLSKGDLDVDGLDKSESNSITNQRMIVENFLENNPDLKLVDTIIREYWGLAPLTDRKEREDETH